MLDYIFFFILHIKPQLRAEKYSIFLTTNSNRTVNVVLAMNLDITRLQRSLIMQYFLKCELQYPELRLCFTEKANINLFDSVYIFRSENRNKIPNAQKIPIMDQFAATQKAKKQSSSKSSNSQNSSTKSNSLKPGGKNKMKTQNLAASLGITYPKHSPLHASPNRKSPNPVR